MRVSAAEITNQNTNQTSKEGYKQHHGESQKASYGKR